MRWLIKDHQITQHHGMSATPEYVPLAEFMACQAGTPAPLARHGVVLQPEDDPETLVPYLSQLKVVAIHFPVFTDGRGYSIARLLRRWHYQGEIRATGDVLQDQLYFMQRSGFNAFELREDQDADACLRSLNAYRWQTEASSSA